jgi:hypothetical protein
MELPFLPSPSITLSSLGVVGVLPVAAVVVAVDTATVLAGKPTAAEEAQNLA